MESSSTSPDTDRVVVELFGNTSILLDAAATCALPRYGDVPMQIVLQAWLKLAVDLKVVPVIGKSIRAAVAVRFPTMLNFNRQAPLLSE